MAIGHGYVLTPDLLLNAYAAGIFPMAEHVNGDEIFWFDPPERGILPLDERFHVPRRLARLFRRQDFTLRFDTAFEQVIRACAASTRDRPTTWINEEIIRVYTQLHQLGHAHSVEVWEGDELVGGLYGVHIASAFFGESMFSRRANASKIALVALVEHLRKQGFSLLDTQFLTPHLTQFGAIEIPRAAYHALLTRALGKDCVW